MDLFKRAYGRPRGAILVSVAGLLVSLLIQPAPSVASTTPSLAFYDGFETDKGWQKFEELVDPSCYGQGIGEVKPTAGIARSGSSSLAVTANKALTGLSNHVIGYKTFPGRHVRGVATFVVWARQEPEAPGRLGETGPEISIQSTSADHTTTIAGIQHLTNPADTSRYGHWQVWRDNGGSPGWVKFMDQPLRRGVWYQLVLQADWSTGRYIRFVLIGDGLTRVVDLSGIPLGFENKGFDEAIVIALEGQNSWTNCGRAAPTTFTMNYDDVVFVSQ